MSSWLLRRIWLVGFRLRYCVISSLALMQLVEDSSKIVAQRFHAALNVGDTLCSILNISLNLEHPLLCLCTVVTMRNAITLALLG